MHISTLETLRMLETQERRKTSIKDHDMSNGAPNAVMKVAQ